MPSVEINTGLERRHDTAKFAVSDTAKKCGDFLKITNNYSFFLLSV